ncbi:TAT-variant-translocated molybdopterin oxidoreductase [Azospirillum sp. A23]|uniref:TAT-variant-translocated molybdopterin oxidoreductase n=1 Tax=Azospirillum sp. A23 TaxID=3160608 RepID=UPI0036F3774D
MTAREELEREELARHIEGRLAGKSGRALWRSLDELSREPSVLEMLRAEFPGLPDLADARVGRRRLLELMGASFALAGLSGCGPGEASETAIPYVTMPAGLVPGVARHFATAVTRGGYADGVLAIHQMGARSSWKAIRTIPPAWARSIRSSRPASSICTIPTAHGPC